MTSTTGQVDADQIRHALLSLYSPTELAKCELAALLPECQAVPDLVQRAQALRNVLLDAAQTLRPANRLGASVAAVRAYNCLMLRYVSGLGVGEVANELSLSSRQVYRDLHWAEERLAELLSSRLTLPLGPAGPAPDAVAQEMEAIAHRPERLSVRDVVRAALSAAQPLAQRYGVALRYSEPEGDWFVTATPGILKQVIIQLLSSVVQSIEGGEVEVDLVRGGGRGALRLRFQQAGGLQRPDLLESALRVADSQGLSCRLRQAGDHVTLQMALPLATRHKVLVLEDSPGACALYERYLENTEFEPLRAADPGCALELAAEEGVSAIVLDIMMPEVDGWTVLQSLKLDPETRTIPVVICSVIADRELGMTLGATSYLTKPVSRTDFIGCLRRTLPAAAP